MNEESTVERLRDRELQPFVVVHDKSALPGVEATDVWALLVDEGGGLVAAWGPQTGDPCPVVLVADADMTVDSALQSDAFALLEPEGAIVLRDKGEGFLGVWAGADLEDALASGPTRLLSDTTLPGDIAIPEVVLRCRFQQGGTTCGSSLSFREKPPVWPDCPNLSNLPPHTFVR